MLTPNAYNEAERAGVEDLPLWLIGAFQPVSFNQLNYQTRVENERDLWRFIDSQSRALARHESARPLGTRSCRWRRRC